ncbi:hypothetical protein EDC04DRAFT_2604996 [Pisolithus marmoratus]|nr:hypothetical protein EDC04DRAFT_2604996 [Pisolithus marmoratus]
MSPFAMAAALCFAISAYRTTHALVAQILEGLGAQAAKEDEERHRAIEEARKAERAHSPCFLVPAVVHREHVGQLARRVTVSSYTDTPIPSRPPSPTPEEPRRIPPPQVSYVKQPPDPAHTWKNVQFPDLQCIPPPKDLNTHSRQQRERDGGH